MKMMIGKAKAATKLNAFVQSRFSSSCSLLLLIIIIVMFFTPFFVTPNTVICCLSCQIGPEKKLQFYIQNSQSGEHKEPVSSFKRD